MGFLLSIVLASLVLLAACRPASEPLARNDAFRDGVPAASGASDAGPQTPWVQDRVRAVAEIYNIAPAGRAWIQGYDLRQMVGQPGWFGSYGNDSWAGVGEAKPSSVLHELGHSYWGAFPVTGNPDLRWSKRPWEGTSAALSQYQSDLETFIQQPPDRYEPLRERLRRLPNLARGDFPDLHHFGEADLVQAVGGNLELLPPILRKYYDSYLLPGPYADWNDAIAWYLGVPDELRRFANVQIGLAHFLLDDYQPLRSEDSSEVAAAVIQAIENEERQRLRDFAEQFDQIRDNEFSLRSAVAEDGGFQFWKGYLSGMRTLHSRHPEILRSDSGPDGKRLARALDAIQRGLNMPEADQPDYFLTAFAEDAFLLEFAVLLKGSVLINVFGDDGAASSNRDAAIIVRNFAQNLANFAREAQRIIGSGQANLEQGAADLEAFLEGLSDAEYRKDLGVLISLLRDTDSDLTESMLNAMGDRAILRLLDNNPGLTRNGNIEPGRLLDVLNITGADTPSDVARGIRKLLEKTSGNDAIDQPAIDLVHGMIADFGRNEPIAALRILKDSDLPILPFIEAQSAVARDLFAADPRRFGALVQEGTKWEYTPWRIVHGTIFDDPDLAAHIVVELLNMDERDIVENSVIVFAFDARRLDALSTMPLSLANDRRFLDAFLAEVGPGVLTDIVAAALARYAIEIDEGRVDPDFIAAYRETLGRILIQPGRDTAKLKGVLNDAFGLAALDLLDANAPPN